MGIVEQSRDKWLWLLVGAVGGVVLTLVSGLLFGFVRFFEKEPTPAPTAISIATAVPTPTLLPTITPSLTPTSTPTPVPSDTPSPTATLPPTPSLEAIVVAESASLRPGVTTGWDPGQKLRGGIALELLGYDPDWPDWVYVRAVEGEAEGWVEIADLLLQRDLESLPLVTPPPTPTPAPAAPPPSPTPTPGVVCEGGPLRLDAWSVSQVCDAGGGWTATVFVEGHGGDCLYIYSWNDEVRGGPMSTSMTFEVPSAGTGSAVVGEASVASAGETVRMSLHIPPPDCD